MMERLTDAIWRYHDETGATSYLVVGERCAAMIDCGMGKRPVMPLIRAVTQLPVVLLLTHAHPDHYGAAAEFDEVWLHERDAAVLDELERPLAVLGAPALPRAKLRTFADGHVFELGGRSLLAVDLAGHTPGSAVFVDEDARAIFSGDAVGSGDIVLMSVPLAYGLAAYRDSLSAFLACSERWADCAWYAGHYHQALRSDGTDNTPCRALVADMIALCDALLAGKLRGQVQHERLAPQERALRAYMGRAGIVYSEAQCDANA